MRGEGTAHRGVVSPWEKNEPPGTTPGGSSAQASDGIPLTPPGLPCQHTVMHGACQASGRFGVKPVNSRLGRGDVHPGGRPENRSAERLAGDTDGPLAVGPG